MRSRATSTPAAPFAPQHPKAALRALHAALARLDVPPTAREIAAALWSHTDAAGRCWPSQRTLARLTGRSERTVRNAVKALAAAGVFLRDVPALRDRRRARRTTAYRFTLGFPLTRPTSAPHVAPVEAPDATSAPAVDDAPAIAALPVAPVEACAPELHPVEVPVDDAPALAFDGFALVALDGEGLDDAPREDASPAAALDGEHLDASTRAPELLPLAPPVEARPSPATGAAPSPATGATRRPLREKTPPTPAAAVSALHPRRARLALPPARPPVARCEPVGALLRPWTSEALAGVAARVVQLGRRSVPK